MKQYGSTGGGNVCEPEYLCDKRDLIHDTNHISSSFSWERENNVWDPNFVSSTGFYLADNGLHEKEGVPSDNCDNFEHLDIGFGHVDIDKCDSQKSLQSRIANLSISNRPIDANPSADNSDTTRSPKREASISGSTGGNERVDPSLEVRSLLKGYARIPKEVRMFANRFRLDGTLPSVDNIPKGCELLNCREIFSIKSKDYDSFSNSIVSFIMTCKDVEGPLINFTTRFLDECKENPEIGLELRTFYALARDSPVSRTYLFDFRKKISRFHLQIFTFENTWMDYEFLFTCFLVETRQELILIEPTFEKIEAHEIMEQPSFQIVSGSFSPSIRPLGRCSICGDGVKYAFKNNLEYSKDMIDHISRYHTMK